ncbi:MAG: TIGR00730 family Rossman fold protein [Calditrichaeota bacterium]|nr:MAG: TIGR00730 family Rossman fold protein [Calditrichota bacterium]
MKRICVYAGSSSGTREEFASVARELGALLAKTGIGVVYGGARVGLMGELAQAALSAGGEVIGVIPRFLVEKEVAHQGLTELRVVSSMHERKRLMAELADGFVALPGGLGTLEEIFEMMTWSQLGLHRKPCGLLNAHGYYDSLIRMLEQMVEHGFVRRKHRELVLVDRNAAALLDKMRAFRPPELEKWLDAGEV